MQKKKMKIAALSLAVLVAGTGAFHAYGSYQQSGESNAQLLAMEDVDAQSFEWSDITGFFDGVGEAISEAVEEWWDSKTHSAIKKEINKKEKSGGFSLTVGASAGVNAEIAQAEAHAEATVQTSETETSEKYDCYECSDGTEYAHCSEIPNPHCD